MVNRHLPRALFSLTVLLKHKKLKQDKELEKTSPEKKILKEKPASEA
jgi:hypothetical protein